MSLDRDRRSRRLAAIGATGLVVISLGACGGRSEASLDAELSPGTPVSFGDLCPGEDEATSGYVGDGVCIVFENHSSADMALVWSYPHGEGFDRLSSCFRSGGFAARPMPWTVELGVAPTGGGTNIVGEPLARLTSADIENPGHVIVHVVVPASGMPSLEAVERVPEGEIGKVC